MAGLFVLFWYVSIIPYYVRLEEREARYSATVVKLAFEREIKSLEQLVVGYAAGLAAHAGDSGAPHAWEAFFSRNMLMESQLAAVVVLDHDGHCLFSQSSGDGLGDGLGDLTDSLGSNTNNGWSQDGKNYHSPVAGYFAHNQEWYLVSGTYIVSTDQTLPHTSRFLLFFRAVDEPFVYKLSRQFRFQFKLNYPVAADDPHLQKISRALPVVVETRGRDYLNVYFELDDISQQAPALVQILFPRNYVAQLRHDSLIHLTFFGGVFIVMAIVLILMVRASTMKSFKDLLDKIRSLKKEQNVRLPVADCEGREVVGLMAAFNALLDDLEQSKIHQACTEQKCDLIQRVVPSAVFTVDENKVVTSWNECATQLTGYRSEEMIGNVCFLFAENPCRENCGLFDETIAKPIMGRECTIRRKDGRLIRISKNVDYLKDTQGRVVGGIECFIDVSNRKSSEEALQWELALNMRLAQLSRSIIHFPEAVEKIAEELLEHSRNLTESPQGFVAMRENGLKQHFFSRHFLIFGA